MITCKESQENQRKLCSTKTTQFVILSLTRNFFLSSSLRLSTFIPFLHFYFEQDIPTGFCPDTTTLKGHGTRLPTTHPWIILWRSQRSKFYPCHLQFYRSTLGGKSHLLSLIVVVSTLPIVLTLVFSLLYLSSSHN